LGAAWPTLRYAKMIRRDYILRMIEEFVQALARTRPISPSGSIASPGLDGRFADHRRIGPKN
jgi:hypothetical protein